MKMIVFSIILMVIVLSAVSAQEGNQISDIFNAIANFINQLVQTISAFLGGLFRQCEEGETGNYIVEAEGQKATKKWSCCAGKKCPEELPCINDKVCGLCETDEDCPGVTPGKVCVKVRLYGETVTLSENFYIYRCGCESDSDCTSPMPVCDRETKSCKFESPEPT